MSHDQGRAHAPNRLAAWLLTGGVLACLWCSTLSGVVGWVLGQDLGWRAGRAEVALLPEPGVLVIRLDQGGPAALAGLRRDDLIVAIDATDIADVQALRAALRDYRPGDEARLSVRRSGQQRTLPVRLGRLPGSNQPYLGIYYTARAEEPGDL